jgi:hypothetical protein
MNIKGGEIILRAKHIKLLPDLLTTSHDYCLQLKNNDIYLFGYAHVKLKNSGCMLRHESHTTPQN